MGIPGELGRGCWVGLGRWGGLWRWVVGGVAWSDGGAGVSWGSSGEARE